VIQFLKHLIRHEKFFIIVHVKCERIINDYLMYFGYYFSYFLQNEDRRADAMSTKLIDDVRERNSNKITEKSSQGFRLLVKF